MRTHCYSSILQFGLLTASQSKYLKKLVGTIKNDLTNYRQHLENAQIADEDEETDDIRLLKLKGRAIECMLYQDYLDISPIEETILFLILYRILSYYSR